MSSAFIDEDSEHLEELPEIPQSTNPGYITPKGLRMLNSERDRLRHDIRPPLADRVEEGEAGAAAAEIELARVEQRIRYLEARIARAIVVDPATAAPDRVHFGAAVTVRDGDGEAIRYEIVGEDETDPEHNRVSCFSPLAKALMTRRVGETAVWHRPIGDLELTVLSIEPIPDND